MALSIREYIPQELSAWIDKCRDNDIGIQYKPHLLACLLVAMLGDLAVDFICRHGIKAASYRLHLNIFKKAHCFCAIMGFPGFAEELGTGRVNVLAAAPRSDDKHY